MNTILDIKWITNSTGAIGVVACSSEPSTWTAYIGVSKGLSMEYDVETIAAWGTALPAKVASAFFPQLDITQYHQNTSV